MGSEGSVVSFCYLRALDGRIYTEHVTSEGHGLSDTHLTRVDPSDTIWVARSALITRLVADEPNGQLEPYLDPLTVS